MLIFDKVFHESLLVKLKAYGFDTEIRNWIREFLSNRKQRVVIVNFPSDWRDVTSGVPQGSVLSPLHFIIFINDMPVIVDHCLKFFADDSKLIATIRNPDNALMVQDDIDALDDYALTWRMLFNYGKCKSMSITKSKSKFKYNYFS
jgi:hypothetical protein